MADGNAERRFWKWFLKHEAELFDFEADRERRFDELAGELCKVHRELTFEFSSPIQDRHSGQTHREFVISAAGIKSAFPAVVSLASLAPVLDRWRVIPFRPRRDPVCAVQIGDRELDPSTVEFTLLDNGKMAGVRLYIPEFKKDDAIQKSMAYLMLDEALGEYDVETRLGLIDCRPLSEKPPRDGRPFAELPELFDRLVARLEGRSGMPS